MILSFSISLDEQIQALRVAQQHYSQARQFQEKANSLKEFLNLQSLHSQVTIMPACFTTLQNEIDKLLENADQEVKKSIYIFLYNLSVILSNVQISVYALLLITFMINSLKKKCINLTNFKQYWGNLT